MSVPGKNVLLTGPSDYRKTAVARRVIERLEGLRLAGFFTPETRQHEQRMDFVAVG